MHLKEKDLQSLTGIVFCILLAGLHLLFLVCCFVTHVPFGSAGVIEIRDCPQRKQKIALMAFPNLFDKL